MSGELLALDAPLSPFDEFWAVCPRRIGKGKAREKFIHATTKKHIPARQLIEAMSRYAQSVVGKEIHFVVHPATWLHQERWDDDPRHYPGTPAPVTSGDKRLDGLRRFDQIARGHSSGGGQP